jgi:hypothetical protein
MPTRFTVELGGYPRALFSVVERRNETTLGIRTDAFQNKHGITTPLKLSELEPSKIIEQKISIHPSPSSPTKINVIKHRKVMANGRATVARNYTKAIKGADGFAFVFQQRCGDLNRSLYISRGKNNISVGAYDPSHFSLIYAIFVGAKETTFTPKIPNGTITITQKSFNNVRVIVLSTFLGIATHPSFFAAQLHTLPSSIPNDPEAGASLSADECIKHFMWYASDQRKEMLQLLEPTSTSEQFDMLKRRSLFFRNGFTDAREYEIQKFLWTYERGFYKINMRLGIY